MVLGEGAWSVPGRPHSALLCYTLSPTWPYFTGQPHALLGEGEWTRGGVGVVCRRRVVAGRVHMCAWGL